MFSGLLCCVAKGDFDPRAGPEPMINVREVLVELIPATNQMAPQPVDQSSHNCQGGKLLISIIPHRVTPVSRGTESCLVPRFMCLDAASINSVSWSPHFRDAYITFYHLLKFIEVRSDFGMRGMGSHPLLNGHSVVNVCVCVWLSVRIVNKLINVYLLSKFALEADNRLSWPGGPMPCRLSCSPNVLFPFAISYFRPCVSVSERRGVCVRELVLCAFVFV